jgi:hypothetical protein
MKIFCILKEDDEYSLKQHPSYGLRLDPLSMSLKKSGATTYPLDKVMFVLIQYIIF